MYEEILSKVLTMYSFTWIKKTKKLLNSAVPVQLWEQKADPSGNRNVSTFRITLMRIRIQLLTLTRIRILPEPYSYWCGSRYWFLLWSDQNPDPTFILMFQGEPYRFILRLLSSNVSLHGSIVSLYVVPPHQCCFPPFHFDADPEPTFHFVAYQDPTSQIIQIHADPDPQHWFLNHNTRPGSFKSFNNSKINWRNFSFD